MVGGQPAAAGLHWVSGIELGIRLLSWVWIRRLLDGWAGAAELFEDNPDFQLQIWHHQRWLADPPQPRLVGEQPRHRRGRRAARRGVRVRLVPGVGALADRGAALAGRAAAAATPSSSGLNRELATEYHGLVLELGLAAVAEADAAGAPVPESTWDTCSG